MFACSSVARSAVDDPKPRRFTTTTALHGFGSSTPASNRANPVPAAGTVPGAPTRKRLCVLLELWRDRRDVLDGVLAGSHRFSEALSPPSSSSSSSAPLRRASTACGTYERSFDSCPDMVTKLPWIAWISVTGDSATTSVLGRSAAVSSMASLMSPSGTATRRYMMTHCAMMSSTHTGMQTPSVMLRWRVTSSVKSSSGVSSTTRQCSVPPSSWMST
mmetsp:Transcript_34029/g.105076  ORF Transcript_34029/g.105076 Transcript_34029/m.105076 type:complete len:217 (-) Transcript_34029:1208-1858(-)